MNIERPTSNIECEKMKEQTYDLEKRLLEYSVRASKLMKEKAIFIQGFSRNFETNEMKWWSEATSLFDVRC
jgi:hypothetical protein